MNAITRFLQLHFGKFWMAVVYCFLYIPLLFLIVFSFNSTRQDAQFTGFSLRWYSELLNDPKLVSHPPASDSMRCRWPRVTMSRATTSRAIRATKP